MGGGGGGGAQEFSIIAELYEGWHFFCVHYQEITSGSHVDFTWTKIAVTVDSSTLARWFPLSTIWGGKVELQSPGSAGKKQTKHSEDSQVQCVQFVQLQSLGCCVHFTSKFQRAIEYYIYINAVQNGFKSRFFYCFIFSSNALLIYRKDINIMLFLAMIDLRTVYSNISIMYRTIADSFTWSVMFLQSKPGLLRLSHIFKWIPWVFSSVVSIIHLKTSM